MRERTRVALEHQLQSYGQRLTVLRAIYNLTQSDLAVSLNVTQSFLSQLERGVRPVPDNLVVQASEEFGLPLTFFSVHPTAAETGPVTFRKSSQATARDESRVTTLYGEASRLFREVSAASGYQPADLPDPDDFDNDPELVADAMRTEAGLGSTEPVLNAIRALERLGVGVIDNLDHFSAEARGHTAISRPSFRNNRPLVALVAPVPGAVKRLTVLHEGGHLIFDRELTGPITGLRSHQEKRAYQFAGAFLLPRRVVLKRVSESLNLHGYLPIKADYGISVGAIIVRSRELGVISPVRARSLQIQLSSQGWRHNEPVPVPDEKPLLIGQALRRVYGNQATAAKAAHDIGASPEWVNKWAHFHTEKTKAELGKVVDLAAWAQARNTA